MRYLTQDHLRAVSQHKYNGRDDSILSFYVLTPLWNWSLKFLPLWLAPNMITLIGTLGLVINYAVVQYYCPGFFALPDTPRWIFLLSGFCLFAYQTLDNLDGKQARRTGSSSPLGQLFDHGCDSLVVTIQALISAALAGFGMDWTVVSLLISGWLLFWLNTWEEYHTGILHLGVINGPDEGIITLVLFFIATFFTGPQFWVSGFKDVTGVNNPDVPNFRLNYLLLISCLVPVIVTSFIILRKVLRFIEKNNESKQEAINHLITYAITAVSTIIWYAIAPELWHAYPRTVMCTIGLSFGEMVSWLILSHMAGNLKVDLILRPQAPLILIVFFSTIAHVFNVQFLLKYEYVLFALYVLATWSSYIHFAYGVVTELATHLKINVFTIPYKKE